MTDFAHTVELTLAVMQQLAFLQYVWIVAVALVVLPRANEKIAHWRHKRDMRRG